MCPDSHESREEGRLSVRIEKATTESVSKCYQCGKCSAGCPLADEMDFPPSQLLRLLQLGLPELDDKAVSSHTIWLCLTCETCVTRCPKEVDFPKIAEFLREESLRRKMVHPKAKDILSFHKAFLDSISRAGRLFEVGLITDYKLRSMHLMQDLLVAPKLFRRGKLKPLPHLIKGRAAVARIFQRTKAKKEEER